LKLKYDKPLSVFPFKFNLRNYTVNPVLNSARAAARAKRAAMSRATADADASAALAEEATTNKWAQKLAALQQPDKDD